MLPGPTVLQQEGESESTGAIRLVAMGQSRISIIIIATINNVLLDCEASGTGKDTVKAILSIMVHTLMKSFMLFSAYSGTPEKPEKQQLSSASIPLARGVSQSLRWIIHSNVPKVPWRCVCGLAVFPNHKIWKVKL